MLSNYDIDLLVDKMGIKKFRGCFYKDTLTDIEPKSSKEIGIREVIGVQFTLMIINNQYILIVMD